jgi:hypothetical protein
VRIGDSRLGWARIRLEQLIREFIEEDAERSFDVGDR